MTTLAHALPSRSDACRVPQLLWSTPEFSLVDPLQKYDIVCLVFVQAEQRQPLSSATEAVRLDLGLADEFGYSREVSIHDLEGGVALVVSGSGPLGRLRGSRAVTPTGSYPVVRPEIHLRGHQTSTRPPR